MYLSIKHQIEKKKTISLTLVTCHFKNFFACLREKGENETTAANSKSVPIRWANDQNP